MGRPVAAIGFQGIRSLPDEASLVSYISISSPESRPLLRAGFVAPWFQFGLRPSPPLDRLAAEGGSKYPDMTSSARLASTQNGHELQATDHRYRTLACYNHWLLGGFTQFGSERQVVMPFQVSQSEKGQRLDSPEGSSRLSRQDLANG